MEVECSLPRLQQRTLNRILNLLNPVYTLRKNYSILTPWSRVLLEKLAGYQIVSQFPAFYGTRRFITAFTSTCHLSLSWARSIQSIPPHPTSWRSILILSSHLRLVLPSGWGAIYLRYVFILCYTMLYYTILCYTMLYCAILCYTMLYYAILCYTILYYAILFYTMLYYSILCYTMLYCAILCYTVLYYSILCYTMLYYAILCYTMLYCAILCYTMLYCAILCYTVLYCAILCYTMLYYAILCYTMLYCAILCYIMLNRVCSRQIKKN